MRISDWSSDVCSSDLCSRHEEPCDDQARPDAVEKSQSEGRPAAARRKDASDEAYGAEAKRDVLHQNLPVPTFATKSRSSWSIASICASSRSVGSSPGSSLRLITLKSAAAPPTNARLLPESRLPGASGAS